MEHARGRHQQTASIDTAKSSDSNSATTPTDTGNWKTWLVSSADQLLFRPAITSPPNGLGQDGVNQPTSSSFSESFFRKGFLASMMDWEKDGSNGTAPVQLKRSSGSTGLASPGNEDGNNSSRNLYALTSEDEDEGVDEDSLLWEAQMALIGHEYKKAVRKLRKAVSHGSSAASLSLGNILTKGLSCKDHGESSAVYPDINEACLVYIKGLDIESRRDISEEELNYEVLQDITVTLCGLYRHGRISPRHEQTVIDSHVWQQYTEKGRAQALAQAQAEAEATINGLARSAPGRQSHSTDTEGLWEEGGRVAKVLARKLEIVLALRSEESMSDYEAATETDEDNNITDQILSSSPTSVSLDAMDDAPVAPGRETNGHTARKVSKSVSFSKLPPRHRSSLTSILAKQARTSLMHIYYILALVAFSSSNSTGSSVSTTQAHSRARQYWQDILNLGNTPGVTLGKEAQQLISKAKARIDMLSYAFEDSEGKSKISIPKSIKGSNKHRHNSRKSTNKPSKRRVSSNGSMESHGEEHQDFLLGDLLSPPIAPTGKSNSSLSDLTLPGTEIMMLNPSIGHEKATPRVQTGAGFDGTAAKLASPFGSPGKTGVLKDAGINGREKDSSALAIRTTADDGAVVPNSIKKDDSLEKESTSESFRASSLTRYAHQMTDHHAASSNVQPQPVATTSQLDSDDLPSASTSSLRPDIRTKSKKFSIHDSPTSVRSFNTLGVGSKDKANGHIGLGRPRGYSNASFVSEVSNLGSSSKGKGKASEKGAPWILRRPSYSTGLSVNQNNVTLLPTSTLYSSQLSSSHTYGPSAPRSSYPASKPQRPFFTGRNWSASSSVPSLQVSDSRTSILAPDHHSTTTHDLRANSASVLTLPHLSTGEASRSLSAAHLLLSRRDNHSYSRSRLSKSHGSSTSIASLGGASLSGIQRSFSSLRSFFMPSSASSRNVLANHDEGEDADEDEEEAEYQKLEEKKREDEEDRKRKLRSKLETIGRRHDEIAAQTVYWDNDYDGSTLDEYQGSFPSSPVDIPLRNTLELEGEQSPPSESENINGQEHPPVKTSESTAASTSPTRYIRPLPHSIPSSLLVVPKAHRPVPAAPPGTPSRMPKRLTKAERALRRSKLRERQSTNSLLSLSPDLNHSASGSANSSGAVTPDKEYSSGDIFGAPGPLKIDPLLAALEAASRVNVKSRCAVCGKQGVNFPKCQKCDMTFCSRACRTSTGPNLQGGKHQCVQ